MYSETVVWQFETAVETITLKNVGRVCNSCSKGYVRAGVNRLRPSIIIYDTRSMDCLLRIDCRHDV